jgi:hypothetical protein
VQDIVSAVTNAQVPTPKHILLPWAIKTLTGNVELIRTLNRLGHSCSYTRLQEIDTALCIEKMNSGGGGKPSLPSGIHPCVPTVLAFDNIDRQEETLSGAGTSHRVNGIIVQPISLSCAPAKGFPTGKVPHPANLSMPLIAATTRASQHNFMWVLARLHDVANQSICSWWLLTNHQCTCYRHDRAVDCARDPF